MPTGSCNFTGHFIVRLFRYEGERDKRGLHQLYYSTILFNAMTFVVHSASLSLGIVTMIKLSARLFVGQRSSLFFVREARI